MTDPDGNLPAALDRLYAAVAGLIDPRKELLGDTIMAAPSLYDELLGELPAVKASDRGYTATHKRSMAPVWLDALDLRTDIDRTIAIGASLAGNGWHRNADRVGLAMVVNGISRERQQFLAVLKC